MPDEQGPRGEPTTVAECRQAIRFHEWELLGLTAELARLRDRTARHRRAFEKGRKACARLWRKCRDRVAAIELMRDLIRSSPDGRTVQTGAPVQSVPAGLAFLERVGEILDAADTESEKGRRALFRELAELQEFAKDFFDYGGVRLVYELGELLAKTSENDSESLGELSGRAAQLRREAGGWFD